MALDRYKQRSQEGTYNISAKPTLSLTDFLPPTAKVFTCFSAFPLEIRREIWLECLPGPRTIRLDRDERWKRQPNPTILAVNQESRSLAQSVYAMISMGGKFYLAFDGKKDIINATGSHCLLRLLGITPNFFSTTPYVCNPPSPGVRPPSARIRSIAIDESRLRHEDLPKHWVALEELIIVLTPVGFRRRSIAPDTRILAPGVEIQPEAGWGDARIHNRIMRQLEEWLKDPFLSFEDKRLDSCGRAVLPVVRLAHWGTMPQEASPFCSALTPLSLRR